MKLSVRLAVIAGMAALSLALPHGAFAAKGQGGGKHGGTGGSSSLMLVLLSSTDGLPHWGQQVRFDVSTTQTAEPHVSLNCYQGGVLVYTTQTGYYASYPWPWTQTMTLSSGAWTAGAADCDARLYSLSNSGSSTTLATMSFHVYA